MFFDDEDMKFNINIPEDTPPDGITNCSEFNDMLTGLSGLVANLDPTDPLESLAILDSVSDLLYQDGPVFIEDNALGILIGQTFMISLMMDSFDEDSQYRFLNSLETGLMMADENRDEQEEPEDTETQISLSEDLICIFRDCDFADSASRQLFMMTITNLAAKEDGSICELLHAKLISLLNVTIIGLLAGMEDEGRNDIITHLQASVAEIAEEDWVPYYNTPSEISDIGDENVEDVKSARAAQRVTFSMCFDVATQEEAIAHFVRSAETVLESENLDVILKVETFDEPLDHPYVTEKPKETRFFDVDKNKALLRKVLQKCQNQNEEQEDQ
jgi:hypothetical protein